MQIEEFILLYLIKNTNRENVILIYKLSKEYLKFLHFHDTSTRSGQNE